MTDAIDPAVSRTLLVRAFCSRYAVVMVAVLVVLGGVGAVATYGAYGTPPETRTEQRVVSSWAVTGTFDHGATVRNGTTAFPAGTVLTDEPLYFERVTPQLDGSFRYTYETTATANATVEIVPTLVYRSVEGTGETATVYWRVTEPLVPAVTHTLRPGETVAVPFSVNVSAAGDQLRRLDAEVGGSPGALEVAVVAIVVHDRTATTPSELAEPVVYRLPFVLQGGTYAVDDTGDKTLVGETVQSVSVTTDRPSVASITGPATLGASLAGLVALGLLRRRGWFQLSSAESRRLTLARERAGFAEWITTGRLADPSPARPTVVVATLEDLVDLAIDSNRRVVADRATDRYVVRDETFDYLYDPTRQFADASVSDDNATGDVVSVADTTSTTVSDGDTAGDAVPDTGGDRSGGENGSVTPPDTDSGRPTVDGDDEPSADTV